MNIICDNCGKNAGAEIVKCGQCWQELCPECFGRDTEYGKLNNCTTCEPPPEPDNID